jgi:hypothetical protein
MPLIWVEKEHQRGAFVRSWKNFRLHLDKYTKDTIDAFISLTHEEINKWEQSLKLAVGTLIPKNLIGKRRPFNRQFPYHLSGKQKRHIKGTVKVKTTGQGNVSLTAKGNIDVPYAYYTNLGKPARGDGRIGMWQGWVDDVLDKKGGRGKVISIVDIFDELVELRKTL